jgi:hypothetical protein
MRHQRFKNVPEISLPPCTPRILLDYIHIGQSLCTCLQVDNNIMAQSPCFLLPLPIPPLHPSLLPSTYLETLLAVIGSRPPWSQFTRELTSPFPPHSKFPVPRLIVRRTTTT